MKPNRFAPWLPFGFSVVLSAISLVAYSLIGGSGAWIPAFLAFTPMTLYFAVTSQNQAQGHIETLEARIRQLEAVSPTALNTPAFQRPIGLAMDARPKAVDAA